MCETSEGRAAEEGGPRQVPLWHPLEHTTVYWSTTLFACERVQQPASQRHFFRAIFQYTCEFAERQFVNELCIVPSFKKYLLF